MPKIEVWSWDKGLGFNFFLLDWVITVMTCFFLSISFGLLFFVFTLSNELVSFSLNECSSGWEFKCKLEMTPEFDSDKLYLI